MKRRKKIPGEILFTLALGLVCCSPISDREREYEAQRQSEEAEREVLKLTIRESANETDVLRLVQESAAVDGSTNTAAWVDQEMESNRWQAIFPRWEVSRRGATRYEVRYTYTLLGAGSEITKQGWTWDVDMALKMVSAPQVIVTQDGDIRPRNNESDQQQHRISAEEASLE